MPNPNQNFDVEVAQHIAQIGQAHAAALQAAEQAVVGVPLLPNVQEKPAEDFSAKYKDTYILATSPYFTDDVIYIADVEHMDDDPKSKNFAILAITSKGERVSLKYKDLKIIASLTSSKFVNAEQKAHYFYRFAERQWKRGLCRTTMGYASIGAGLTSGATLSAYYSKGKIFNKKPSFPEFKVSNIGTYAAEKLFKPTYDSYLEAISHLKTCTRISCAFHPSYAVCLSAVHEGFDLYRETSNIGKIRYENPSRIELNSTLFLQEVNDLFRRIGHVAYITAR